MMPIIGVTNWMNEEKVKCRMLHNEDNIPIDTIFPKNRDYKAVLFLVVQLSQMSLNFGPNPASQ